MEAKRSITRAAAVAAVALCMTVSSAAGGAGTADDAGTGRSSSTEVANPGFESGTSGWEVRGVMSALSIDDDGRAGSQRLVHSSERPYTVRTAQRVTGLEDGWYTLEAWVSSGGALDASTVGLTGCGTDGSTTTPLTEDTHGWVRVAVSAYVDRGGCTIELATKAGRGGAWAAFDDVSLRPGRSSVATRGVDVSTLAKNEDHGAVYRDPQGRVADPVELLADAGSNLMRLKVWVDPADGYNDASHVVASALRAEAAGMDVLVDFHYSDRWADPGHQEIPEAWMNMNVDEMATAVHDHTEDVLGALEDAGVTVDMVQVGNEINSGMLWPYGQTWDVDPEDGVDGAQWDALASFLTAGASAVREAAPDAEVMLHLAEGGNVGTFTWWFDEITARGVDFDLIGVSFYGFWHGAFPDLQQTLDTVTARYDRDVVVVETAYPFTLDDADGHENIIDLESELVPGYPATPPGQAAYLRAVMDVVAAVPDSRGRGVVYWEPAWTGVEGSGWDPEDPSQGNAWENQAHFDFDGRLLPVARELAMNG